jgi:hypothetical protein
VRQQHDSTHDTRRAPPSHAATTTRPQPDAAGPDVRVALCADHRIRVGAPAALVAVVHHRPALCGAARARRHHRRVQAPRQR